jgi:hypothetical protein
LFDQTKVLPEENKKALENRYLIEGAAMIASNNVQSS